MITAVDQGTVSQDIAAMFATAVPSDVVDPSAFAMQLAMQQSQAAASQQASQTSQDPAVKAEEDKKNQEVRLEGLNMLAAAAVMQQNMPGYVITQVAIAQQREAMGLNAPTAAAAQTTPKAPVSLLKPVAAKTSAKTAVADTYSVSTTDTVSNAAAASNASTVSSAAASNASTVSSATASNASTVSSVTASNASAAASSVLGTAESNSWDTLTSMVDAAAGNSSKLEQDLTKAIDDLTGQFETVIGDAVHNAVDAAVHAALASLAAFGKTAQAVGLKASGLASTLAAASSVPTAATGGSSVKT